MPLVLPGSKTRQEKVKGGTDQDGAEEEPLSRSQLRKLKQVQQKKARRENIAQVGRRLSSVFEFMCAQLWYCLALNLSVLYVSASLFSLSPCVGFCVALSSSIIFAMKRAWRLLGSSLRLCYFAMDVCIS